MGAHPGGHLGVHLRAHPGGHLGGHLGGIRGHPAGHLGGVRWVILGEMHLGDIWGTIWGAIWEGTRGIGRERDIRRRGGIRLWATADLDEFEIEERLLQLHEFFEVSGQVHELALGSGVTMP